jgi:hypothetical protein
MSTIICEDCGDEVEEGEALNGYCPRCVDNFVRREETEAYARAVPAMKKYEQQH